MLEETSNEKDSKQESSEKVDHCLFIKPRKKGNIRKRTSEYTITEDDSENSIKRKQKTNSGGIVVSTKSTNEVSSKNWSKDRDVYKSSGEQSNVPSFGVLATSENEIDSKKKEDESENKVLTGDEAENAEKLYRGMNNYTQYLDKTKQHGIFKGAGIQQGPQRITSHIRWSIRMDYQPDVCKDYKETGYCGYGDSCKFMHDRGDYKTGWELEKEWEEQQRQKRMGIKRNEENYEIHPDEDIPFACFICRKPFTDPIQTKCRHFFCEQCALKTFKKDMKCKICGENTFGSFSAVDKKTKEKLDQRLKRAIENGELASFEENQNEE